MGFAVEDGPESLASPEGMQAVFEAAESFEPSTAGGDLVPLDDLGSAGLLWGIMVAESAGNGSWSRGLRLEERLLDGERGGCCDWLREDSSVDLFEYEYEKVAWRASDVLGPILKERDAIVVCPAL